MMDHASLRHWIHSTPNQITTIQQYGIISLIKLTRTMLMVREFSRMNMNLTHSFYSHGDAICLANSIWNIQMPWCLCRCVQWPGKNSIPKASQDTIKKLLMSSKSRHGSRRTSYHQVQNIWLEMLITHREVWWLSKQNFSLSYSILSYSCKFSISLMPDFLKRENLTYSLVSARILCL